MRGDSDLVSYLIGRGIEFNDDDIFDDVVEYQDTKIIDYFLTTKPVDIGNSSDVLWTTYKLIQKQNYLLVRKYLGLKFNTWYDNYQNGMEKYLFEDGFIHIHYD